MSRLAPVRLEHVWKKYRIGSQHNSLRDAVPAALKSLFNRKATALREDEFWAVKDVSFEVQAGETLGVIGRNGAGKSTLLKLLSSITRPSAGSVSVNGKLAGLIEVGAGFHPDLTGRENVYLNGTILGLRRREVHTLFDRIVDFAELEKFIDTPVKRYSSGMYVRLGFAIAAHVNPDVLLIDEVLAVGDISFQQKCMQRIQELKEAGTTMLFISHNLNAVERICDRAILMSQGSVSASGSVEAVIRAYREQVVTKEKQRFANAMAKQEAQGGSGGQGIYIENIQVRNKNDEAAETIETGEPLTIEIAYRCARPIQKPTVRVTIDRLDGLLCHVAETGQEGETLEPINGKGVIRLTYPSLNLLHHTYRVSVEMSEEGAPMPLDQRQYGCFFTVTSNHHETGVVHLDHYWHAQPQGR